jgi:hypothetical protein
MAKTVSVDEWLAGFSHPLAAELQALRGILNSLEPLTERIKWNAPSWHVGGVDVATMMVRRDDDLLLIFHHPRVVDVESPLFEEAHDDGRRIAHFRSMDAVAAGEHEVRRVVAALVAD